jgi:hypothetical protein
LKAFEFSFAGNRTLQQAIAATFREAWAGHGWISVSAHRGRFQNDAMEPVSHCQALHFRYAEKGKGLRNT